MNYRYLLVPMLTCYMMPHIFWWSFELLCTMEIIIYIVSTFVFDLNLGKYPVF